MTRRLRLDAELVRRGLARSRAHAGQLIADGRVTVAGTVATKAATGVDTATAVAVHGARSAGSAEYVSRGGHKLAAALDQFAAAGLTTAGRRCLDAGASTGGFTDALLRRGAAHVVAVDVGYGQLHWRLRTDPRVTVVERTNVRELDPHVVGAPVDLVVADLSFISLRLVLPALRRCATADADLVVLVKPQFEVGREHVGAGGVVRDPVRRAQAVRDVAAGAEQLGLGVRGVTASPLPGPSGNVEYFLWLSAGGRPLDEADLARAVERGPA